MKYTEYLPSCEVVFVSNGYCYKAYRRENGEFQDKPVAYMNLLRPTDKYPLDNSVEGCLEIFRLLIP